MDVASAVCVAEVDQGRVDYNLPREKQTCLSGQTVFIIYVSVIKVGNYGTGSMFYKGFPEKVPLAIWALMDR